MTRNTIEGSGGLIMEITKIICPFGISRELKEVAFIRLTVMPIRGVLEWSEVQYDELPAAVQDQYTAPK